ncbi:MAG: autoinducer synthase, partial [Alphaproteobacteria bacterium]|nr:autoinducer synthase [Alphaproteobacteria bacterium]
QLVTALADYALRHGIGEYVGVAEAGWYHTISKFGWKCRTLGPVHRDGACRILALSIAIDEETLPGLQRTGTYAPLVLKFEEGGEPGL